MAWFNGRNINSGIFHGRSVDLNRLIAGFTPGTRPTVYGWHVDPSISDPAQAVTYLADAVGKTPAAMGASSFSYGDWANAFFMPKPCMLRYDGTVAYYLDPNDYTKKEDGTASDVANANFAGNAMMEWPLIWYKFEAGEADGEGSFYCSNKQVDSSYKCWCNYDVNNNIIPHFYTAIYNGTGTSKLRSLSGVRLTPSNGNGMTTILEDMSRASANNTQADIPEWTIHTWCDRSLINALIVLMTKTLDSQSSIGKGISSGGQSAKENYVTGSLNNKGLFNGDVSGESTAVKVFGMENWWGCVWTRVAGLNTTEESGKCLYKLTIGTIDGSTAEGYNTTGDGYIKTNILTTDNLNYSQIKKMSYGKHGMLPISADAIGPDASISGWYSDGFFNPPVASHAMFGGSASQSSSHVGCFDLSIGAGAGFKAWYMSASLSCKPRLR